MNDIAPPTTEANPLSAVRLLEEWMKIYRPEELFDVDGALKPEIAALAPAGDRRMSATDAPAYCG